MKKITALLLSLMLAFTPVSYAAFDETVEGTTNRSDLDTVLTTAFGDLQDTLENMKGWKNLKAVRTSVTSVTVTADRLWLQQDDDIARYFSSVSEVIDITSSGAGGLDAGSEANTTFYYFYIIAKDDNTIDGLLSTSSTSPTMPSGYVYKTLLGAVFNDGSGNFVDFVQHDRWAEVFGYSAAASGDVGSGSWTAIDVTNFVPSGVSNLCWGAIANGTSQSSDITNDSSVDSSMNTPNRNEYGQGSSVSTNGLSYFKFTLKTANTLYWQSGGAACHVYINGYYLNKI